MDLKALTEYLVKKLVTNKDAVLVEEKKENDTYIVDVFVAEEDMAKLIGRDGKIINAVRTIVQASGYINEKHSVRINVNAKN